VYQLYENNNSSATNVKGQNVGWSLLKISESEKNILKNVGRIRKKNQCFKVYLVKLFFILNWDICKITLHTIHFSNSDW
jgi:hypothetical protein